jgi:predicted metal-dependent hydrolase
MKIIIEYQDQFGKWHRFQEKHNAADAYQVAKNRAESTKKRHRLMVAKITFIVAVLANQQCHAGLESKYNKHQNAVQAEKVSVYRQCLFIT